MPIDRTIFLVDGFNLYHSVVIASNDMGGKSTKWLNIRALCESYLHLFGQDSRYEGIYYFSALAHHMNIKDPNTVIRHQIFIDCLKDTGVKENLARFKEKEILCKKCHQFFKRHEEKETDVALSIKLIELLWQNQCDTAVLITGDTDISPAIRLVQTYFPNKRVGILFPYKRHNRELKNLVGGLGFNISKEQYARYQFSDPFVLSNGSNRSKPISW
jgi:uncharacterized LabA/DUF88 family protein